MCAPPHLTHIFTFNCSKKLKPFAFVISLQIYHSLLKQTSDSDHFWGFSLHFWVGPQKHVKSCFSPVNLSFFKNYFVFELAYTSNMRGFHCDDFMKSAEEEVGIVIRWWGRWKIRDQLRQSKENPGREFKHFKGVRDEL
jgi:hypothetical protein